MDYFGRGKLNILPDILNKWNSKRILLVTGKRSFDESPKKKEFLGLLSNYEIRRHKEFDINPKYEDISIGSKIVAKFNPDVIIGIGGGSVLDTAKLLSILPSSRDKIKKIIKTSKEIDSRSKKLILIPTTAGSGSEATHFAVCYIGNVKYSIAHKALLPDVTILDSELTDTLPKTLTAISAFDALSQSIESMWAVNANDDSFNYAEQALKKMVPILPRLFSIPTIEHRDEILIAANLAGKAINISKTTGPHSLSYYLTMKHSVPHGLAVILILRGLINYNCLKNVGELNSQLESSNYYEKIDKILNIFEVQTCEELTALIKSYLITCNFKSELKFYLNKESLLNLANNANTERLNNNPKKLSVMNIRILLSNIYDK